MVSRSCDSPMNSKDFITFVTIKWIAMKSGSDMEGLWGMSRTLSVSSNLLYWLRFILLSGLQITLSTMFKKGYTWNKFIIVI